MLLVVRCDVLCVLMLTCMVPLGRISSVMTGARLESRAASSVSTSPPSEAVGSAVASDALAAAALAARRMFCGIAAIVSSQS